MSLKRYNEVLDFVNKNGKAIEAELSVAANEFLQANFGMNLEIPITLNGRLTRSLGRFRHSSTGRSVGIEISKLACVNALMAEDKTELFGILKHECVHYALFEKNLPFFDEDKHFIETCQALDVPLTGIINLAKPTHIYECEAGHKIGRSRKFDEKKYNCECGAKLKYLGQELI